MQYHDDFYDGLKEKRNTLYRQIDTVAVLNKLLSTLYCETNNLKNYKTNLIGDHTLIYKEYINKLINILNESKDKLQELIKIKDGYPLYQLNDIENISLIKTLPSIDYKTSIALTNINNELKIIKKLIHEAIDNADKEGDYTTIITLSDLKKELDIYIHNIFPK